MSIISIGYSRRSIEEFTKALVDHGVRYLIDVRTKPFSKYSPDFNRENLQIALKNVGVKYVFMGDAVGGLPSDPECYTDGKVDYRKTADSDVFKHGLERLIKANNLSVNVSIMCAEMKPEQCHRSKLIGEELLKKGIGINHLDEKNVIRTQKEIIDRITKGQYSMFDDEFTSVKKYR
ncbi:TPA: DUF488 domain-containing protein [Vibrio parahaemolyticus]|uniref:DUF488 domain-containing protein n=3 Tax=Vibrio parahaemolyticus TaxID=670 RepID=UPI000A38B381|nr:DUF488 domain-containing protein [Vibrio parahaemolyticus]MCC4210942.1 DUF488 domain-containing protein [Vibrio parahaemolyticus]MDF4628368.1 DUF488 domain-containing protein [Vibrio parahaemolyticus]OUJ37963.1 hypothetical protein BTZ05_24250 [Vibrio parahaemolyticus]UPR07826.1 DUF488 domain-containing protein [Vibrio parahaemolyticus]HAV1379301.1 DUF488 domain-containing protein [Vibrio parahaemolyticus]